MQYLIYFYPAITSLVGAYCYKRDSRRMQKFYRRMSLSYSARRLFANGLLLLMLIFNFWYLHAFGVDKMFCIATVMCGVMFSFRTAERVIYRLQTAEGLALAFTAMLACVVIPHIWPVAMCIYILTVGSFFYPSKKLMSKLSSPKQFTELAVSSDNAVIEDYYSR